MRIIRNIVRFLFYIEFAMLCFKLEKTLILTTMTKFCSENDANIT